MSESSPALPHQFADSAQQRDTVQIGMWAFLLTELMFFGGLFATYTIYRYAYAPGFAAASRQTDLWLGALNTAILLISSLTMALAVQAAKAGTRKPQVLFLSSTALLGAVFLVLKGVEYAHHIADHLFPGPGFVFPPPHARAAELFFYLYFAMTGVHAIHMAVGILLVAGLAWRTRRGKYTATYHTPVEITGLYWHFVDLIWIFLFPLLYLIGRH